MRLRKSTCPAASAPYTWNTCFAMSKPIVLTCPTDASFGGSLTPPPWHTDAVGGRPLHHPERPPSAGIVRFSPLANQQHGQQRQDARAREPQCPADIGAARRLGELAHDKFRSCSIKAKSALA